MIEGIGKVNSGYACNASEQKNGQIRHPIAMDILEQAEKLVVLSGQLAARTEDRLHSVLRQSNPVEADKKAEVARSLPPLFDALRDKFEQIEQNMQSICGTLERVEL